ncbi:MULTISPECIES: ATP-binding cassette domain-containing protein [unclassified Lysinibacillus]|uniref:ATP-binding cassette domain-containing protein n=1 Tax=unclassified Lysinibacillus TaxID=2636778 RepID=UPI00381A5C34
MSRKEVVVEVKNLKVVFGRGKNKFIAIDDVSFDILKGETFGLVGESGSGKTTIGRAIMRINEVTEGQILYHGKKLNGKISKEWDREITQKIQMIFQDPMASLNERAKVDYIISEGLMNTKNFKNEADRQQKVRNALLNVGLLPEFSSRFPHEFSGGQRQRIGIARALVMEPEFIIADEPISALDVSIRAQVLNLLANLQQQNDLTYLFIAHDLSVVRFITDRTAVIYKGKIVELAETEKLFANPLHPYTKALLSAVPEPNPYKERDKVVEIYDPSQHNYDIQPPSFTEIEEGHFVLANEEELERYRTSLKMEVSK